MTPIRKQSFGILIPTWDRPEEVMKRLYEIERYFEPGQYVHIQVNPGSHGARDIKISNYPDLNISIQENDSNVGFFGNIIFGLNRISTEWIWVLGDDDELHPECHDRIQKALSFATVNTNVLIFNQWQRADGKMTTCATVSSLLRHSIYGELLFISGLIWKKTFLMNSLQLFIEYAFSWSSQVAIVIKALSDKRIEALVVNLPLVNYQEFHRWSRLKFHSRVTHLLRLEINSSEKSMLASSLYPQLVWSMRSSLSEVKNGDYDYFVWLRTMILSFGEIH